MIKEQLNVLINLAASDRTVGEKEAKIIHIIGKANGLSKDEVDAMLKKTNIHERWIGNSRFILGEFIF